MKRIIIDITSVIVAATLLLLFQLTMFLLGLIQQAVWKADVLITKATEKMGEWSDILLETLKDHAL